jgi:hypothetical protein
MFQRFYFGRRQARVGFPIHVPNKVAAYAGTPVECCGCEALLYKLRHDIHHYDTVMAEDFEPVKGPPLINGQAGICPFCKHDYLGCFIQRVADGDFEPWSIAWRLLHQGEEVDIVTGMCYSESSSTEEPGSPLVR